jgi:hypothetical protein
MVYDPKTGTNTFATRTFYGTKRTIRKKHFFIDFFINLRLAPSKKAETNPTERFNGERFGQGIPGLSAIVIPSPNLSSSASAPLDTRFSDASIPYDFY